jgi:hypothetical protein
LSLWLFFFQFTPLYGRSQSDYSSVFECLNIGDIAELVDFYQYKTANTKDSPLSLHLDENLQDAQKEELLIKLLDVAKADRSDFIFDSILRNKIKEIRKMRLSDTTLSCDRVKGFFHKNNPNKNGNRSQLEIDSMFKHIRNSFAHGRICFVNDFLILEDKTNELTARLIITIDILKEWKLTILQYADGINKED